jgi:hypothetical protein
MRNVKIVSDGIGYGTKVFDALTGTEIKGVTGVRWTIDADTKVATAQIDLLSVAFESTETPGNFYMVDPRDGKLRCVTSVTFDDGAVMDL